jgi:hypothetical protein
MKNDLIVSRKIGELGSLVAAGILVGDSYTRGMAKISSFFQYYHNEIVENTCGLVYLLGNITSQASYLALYSFFGYHVLKGTYSSIGRLYDRIEPIERINN